MGSKKKKQHKMSTENKITPDKTRLPDNNSQITVNKINILADLDEKEVEDEKINTKNTNEIKKNTNVLKNFFGTVKKGFLKEIATKTDNINNDNNKTKALKEKYNFKVFIKYEATILLSNAIQLNALQTKLLLPIVSIFRRKDFKENLFNFLKIILLSHFIIKDINTSRLYHLIKLQSYMKIFALINLLQLIEKLTSTILVDLTATRDNKKICFLLELPILFVNSLVIIMQALTYNVIINSRNNKKLNILLLTISFNKLKSTTFKKFTGSSLFQIILQDSNDRFQLNLALLIVCLKNYYHFGKIIQLISVTMLTDWIHQLFIVRYNSIDINIFSVFKEVMLNDYETKNIIYRLGMPVDGHIITCIVLLYRRKIQLKTWIIFISSFLILKIILIFSLEKLVEDNKRKQKLGISLNKTNAIDNDVTRFIKGSLKNNNINNNKRTLSEIVRYEMNGKKIF